MALGEQVQGIERGRHVSADHKMESTSCPAAVLSFLVVNEARTRPQARAALLAVDRRGHRTADGTTGVDTKRDTINPSRHHEP
eukprot:1143104-Pelagomonas_calceolata.AAC.5